jgi:phage gpG-like protein
MNNGVFSLLEFAAELKAIDHDLEAMGPEIVERACQIVQKKAKSAMGKEHEMWAPLAESTIKDKQAHGYKTPAPLLRTGELRDSIEYTVSGNEGCVGSDSEIALFQELGTSKIPPRSFLVSSAISSEDKIHRMAGAATVCVLSGRGRHAADVRELLHLLHQAGHELYEIGHDLLEDEDAEEGKHR